MWKLKPSLERGGYTFNGPLFCTPDILQLPPYEVLSIINQIRDLVKRQGTVDYLQILEHPERDRKIYAIDSCLAADREYLLNQGGISQKTLTEHSHWTLLFSDEY